MTIPYSGSCSCGAVHYECKAQPNWVVHCFCTDCQKLTGSQMSTNLMVPRTEFTLTKGKPKTYTTTGDSGKKVKRSFCENCGSALWSEPDSYPDVIVIKAGSLDDSDWVEPGASVYVDSAPKWGVIPDKIPAFAKMPPAD